MLFSFKMGTGSRNTSHAMACAALACAPAFGRPGASQSPSGAFDSSAGDHPPRASSCSPSSRAPGDGHHSASAPLVVYSVDLLSHTKWQIGSKHHGSDLAAR